VYLVGNKGRRWNIFWIKWLGTPRNVDNFLQKYTMLLSSAEGEITKTVLIILTLLMGLFCVSPCRSAEWTLYRMGSDGIVHSYDKKSIVIDGDVVRVWIRIDFQPVTMKENSKEYQKDGYTFDRTRFSQIIGREEYDCRLKRMATLVAVHYNEKGAVLASVTAKEAGRNQWSDIMPGYTTEALYKIVCEVPKEKTSPTTVPKKVR